MLGILIPQNSRNESMTDACNPNNKTFREYLLTRLMLSGLVVLVTVVSLFLYLG